MPRVRKAIIIILVVAFLHQVTRFCDNSFTSVTVPVGDIQYKACKYEVAEWVNNIDIAFYYTTYFTFRIFFVFVIPCTALITLNYLLFRALKRAEAKRTELLKSKFKLVGGKYRHIHHQNHFGHHYSMGQYENTTIARENSSFISATMAQAPSTDVSHQQSKSHPIIKQAANFHISNHGKDQSRNVVSGRSMSTVSENEGQHAASGGGTDTKSVSSRRAYDSLKQQASIEMMHRREDLKGFTVEPIHTNDEGDGELNNSIGSKEDDESVDVGSLCPECASYGRDDFASSDICPRCSALLIDTDKTSTGTHSADRGGAIERVVGRRCERTGLEEHNNNQTISQCSSLIGAVTHTTTNEDSSSLLATQNVSSSMLPQTNEDGDATLDVIDGDEYEAGAMTSGAQDEESSMSSGGYDNHRRCQQPSTRKKAEENKADSIGGGLMKSTSIDSRLACGCLVPTRTRRAPFADVSKQRRHNCVTCRRLALNDYSMQNSSQDSHMDKKRTTSTSSSKQSRSGSSASEHHVRVGKCNEGGDDDDGSASRASSIPCIDCEYNQQVTGRRANGGKRAEGRGQIIHSRDMSTRIPASQSDHAEKASSVDNYRENNEQFPDSNGGSESRCQTDLRKSQELEFARRMLATTTATTTNTTTTTTTTLYSANTNSIGSLLQVTQPVGTSSNGNSKNHNRGIKPDTVPIRTKSPSFASSTGRGSRATLLGVPGVSNSALNSTALPLIISSGRMVTTATPASMRTMDSNRTTLMLIVVVTVFLMVEVPVAIVTILHVMLNLFDVFKDIQIGTSLDYIKLFTNFFIAISYSVNFSIYCSMSKKFRETFRDLFMCGRRNRRRAEKLLYRNNDHHHQLHQVQQTTQTFQPGQFNLAQTHQTNVSHQFDERYSQTDCDSRGQHRIRQQQAFDSSEQFNNQMTRCNTAEGARKLINNDLALSRMKINSTVNVLGGSPKRTTPVESSQQKRLQECKL